MSTTTPDIFRNGIVSVYRLDEDGDVTVTGELTLAVCPEADEHGMADNHTAEERVRAELRDKFPDLLARLEFDSEAGQFFAYAKNEADAIALAGFITGMARDNERQAPPEPYHRRKERVIAQVTALDADEALRRQATKEELHTLATDPVIQSLRAEMVKRLYVVLDKH